MVTWDPALQKLVRCCIAKLEEIGLQTKVLVYDQGSNNRSFLNKLENVSIQKPYFVCNGRKVLVMYDPPHLLKNIRNNLIKSNYKYDDVEVKWEYVLDFYNKDKDMSIRMAPKLTQKHVALPPFTAMRVNIAAQTLSHSVAAGIQTLCALNYLPEDASATAEFIETMDQLFNTFNSASTKSTHKFKHALSNSSGHLSFLDSCLRFLSKLKTNNGASIPCIVGWQISIWCLKHLWKDLQKNGFKFLLTNRLNQDCLENLFSIIRGKGGHRDNPNVQQFRAEFRQLIIDKLFIVSKSANCEMDTHKILLDISNTTLLQKQAKKTYSSQEIPCTELLAATMPPPCIEKQNVVSYMAGYLIKKFPVAACETCSQLLKAERLPESHPTSSLELIRFKTYKESKCLVIPSSVFSQFVQHMETLFSALFSAKQAIMS